MFTGKITQELLKLTSGEFTVESIHTLKLCDRGIDDLHCIGECTGLERVDLSRNNIAKLYNFAGLTQINYLNLTSNKISSLEGLQSLENLEILNLAGNSITSVDSLRCLAGLEKLKDLRLQDPIQELTNPVCSLPHYTNDVLQLLPNLVMLDGERVRGKGSELFRMYNEIDIMLTAQEPTSNDCQIKPGPWISAELLRANKSDHDAVVAEQQLEELLGGCEYLCSQTEMKLSQILQEFDKPST